MQLGVSLGIPYTLGKPAYAFSPLDLSPVLWLDASDTSTITESGGAVSQWDDKSGNGNDFTQATAAAQPSTGTRTQNGLNVLDFVRGDFLNGGDILDLLTDSFSIFGVVKFDDTADSTPYGKHSTLGDGRYGLFRISGNLQSQYDVDVPNSSSASVADSSTDTRVLSQIIERDGASSTNTLRRNQSATVKSFTDPGTSWNTSNLWRIGRYGESTSYDFDGFIGEIVMLLRTASATEIANTETYLADKWGITL